MALIMNQCYLTLLDLAMFYLDPHQSFAVYLNDGKTCILDISDETGPYDWMSRDKRYDKWRVVNIYSLIDDNCDSKIHIIIDDV